jgi:hypothetical protein
MQFALLATLAGGRAPGWQCKAVAVSHGPIGVTTHPWPIVPRAVSLLCSGSHFPAIEQLNVNRRTCHVAMKVVVAYFFCSAFGGVQGQLVLMCLQGL